MEGISGYIDKVTFPNGKTYALKAYIEEVRPLSCTKCGGPLKLKYGHGQCKYCGTYYAVNCEVVEE